jgi:DnaJ domain
MALLVSAFLIGAATVLAIFFAAMYVVSRRAGGADRGATSNGGTPRRDERDSARMWSWHVGSLDEPGRLSPAEEIPAWKRHAAAAHAGDPGIYKTRSSTPFRGEHWDPYAESQSRANRAKAARRKPRPHRSPLPPEPADPRAAGRDPYELLGVSRVASSDEIERAYRRQVSTIHPDKFHGDPIGRQHAHEQLKQLNAAMQVLRDRRGRVEYDRGHTP